MTEKEFTDLTGLGDKALEIIERTNIKEEDYSYYKYLFDNNEEEFNNVTAGKADLILKLYTDFAIEAEAEYQNRNISNNIYIDTFSDFAIWFTAADSKGILNSRWLMRHIKLRLFKLGRLQFEMGKDSIHIHIPATGPLDMEKCISSLKKADSFFDPRYRYFDCSSWLLSPALNQLLDENSNIIRFQRLFTVTETDPDNRQAEERVFGRVSDNRESYSENTILQRNLKRYLLESGKPGTGYGIIERSRISSGQLSV